MTIIGKKEKGENRFCCCRPRIAGNRGNRARRRHRRLFALK